MGQCLFKELIMKSPTEQRIRARAYELWQARGCPEGSPEEDWFHAAEQLRSHSLHS